jgi:parallel beta-helix repeat protein
VGYHQNNQDILQRIWESGRTRENIISNNLISGNLENGIYLGNPVTDNIVYSNQLGTSHSGKEALANRLHGIWIDSVMDNCIGGENELKNIIGYNLGLGIYFNSKPVESTYRQISSWNDFFNNQKGGIGHSGNYSIN